MKKLKEGHLIFVPSRKSWSFCWSELISNRKWWFNKRSRSWNRKLFQDFRLERTKKLFAVCTTPKTCIRILIICNVVVEIDKNLRIFSLITIEISSCQINILYYFKLERSVLNMEGFCFGKRRLIWFSSGPVFDFVFISFDTIFQIKLKLLILNLCIGNGQVTRCWIKRSL